MASALLGSPATKPLAHGLVKGNVGLSLPAQGRELIRARRRDHDDALAPEVLPSDKFVCHLAYGTSHDLLVELGELSRKGDLAPREHVGNSRERRGHAMW